jgi:hypothetical protein
MDMTFELLIETDAGESDLLNLLSSGFIGATRFGGYIEYLNNLMHFEKTFNHDREKIFSTEFPWMYYRYALMVYPLKDKNLEHQKQLAAELVLFMKKHAEFVELIADFELN